MKDTTFFDAESYQYSKKRYTQKADSYLQAFFNHRLDITKRYLGLAASGKKNLALLEVGCADGVILREMGKEFPTEFSSLAGVDIAPEMISQAKRQNTDSRTSFFVRSEYPAAIVDVVVETGVINYSNVEEELRFAAQQLNIGGFFILSIAGTGSIYNRLKHDMLQDFRPYREYMPLISRYFDVLAVEGAGFFIPLIWKAPVLARPIQAAAEMVFGRIAPGLCHEKMYLLQKHA